MMHAYLIVFLLGFLTHFALVNPRMILNGVIWYVNSLIECTALLVNLYAIRWALGAVHELHGQALHAMHEQVMQLHELNGQALHNLDELAALCLDLLLRFVSLLLSLFE